MALLPLVLVVFDVLAGIISLAPEWMQTQSSRMVGIDYISEPQRIGRILAILSLCGPLLEINRGVLNRAHWDQ